MSVLILGAGGRVGGETARMLKQRGKVTGLILADRDLEAAKAVAVEVGGEAVSLDAADTSALVGHMRKASMVLNTVGPFSKLGIGVLTAAIEARVPYADVNDELEPIQEIWRSRTLHNEAAKAGIPVIVCLGTSPGLTNIIARYGADKMDEVRSINMALATGPWSTSIGVWEHRLHVNQGQATIFRDSAWIEVPAMSEPERIQFPWKPYGANVRIVSHPEPLTLPRRFPTLKEVTMKIGYPDFMNELIEKLVAWGMSSTEKINVGDHSIAPRDMVAAYLASATADRAFGFSAMRRESFSVRQIRLVGTRAGRDVATTYQACFVGGPRETALPLVIAAELLSAGKIQQRGILAPEDLDPQPFIEELIAAGVRTRVIEDSLDSLGRP